MLSRKRGDGTLLESLLLCETMLSAQSARVVFAVTVAVLACGCGSTTTLPQAPATHPLTAPAVPVRQTGTAPVSILPGSITYMLDDSGSLVVRMSVKSNASAPVTLTVRGSLYDAAGTITDDVTGGQVGITSGATAQLELNGPPPSGEIASATYEFTSLPLP